MSAEHRQAKARQLCALLSEQIARTAPAGIGRWAPAWEMVEAPSKRFLDALDRWEQTGAAEEVARVRGAYDAVVQAWEDAARLFTQNDRQGCTEPALRNPAGTSAETAL